MQFSRNQKGQAAGTSRHLSPIGSRNGALGLALANAGLPVHPFIARGGRLIPASSHGRKDATREPAQIEEWARHGAMFAIPTGTESGIWAFDFDQPHGPAWLNAQMQLRAIESAADITPVWSATKSGGLHAFFRYDDGCPARSRASDIALGVDTRAKGGSIVCPGNSLGSGKSYALLDLEALAEGRIVRLDLPPYQIAAHLRSAPIAPRWMLKLSSFNFAERAVIAAGPELQEVLRDAEPADWHAIVERRRSAHRAAVAERLAHAPPDAEGMRAQALHDLHEAAGSYTTFKDGRRQKLFSVTARLARYVAHGTLLETELRSALHQAATANGALTHGERWFAGCISRALRYGQNDQLPPLARRFRTGAGVGA